MVQAVMRKNQRLVWGVIIVVVVITFVIWGGPDLSGRRSGSPGTIYGKNVGYEQYRDAYRTVYLTVLLFTGQDPERGEQGQAFMEQQTWLRLIQRQKIEEWGVTVTDEELGRYVWTMPMFLTNGQPDRQKYDDFANQFLRSRGYSAADFERIMSEYLAVQKMNEMVGSTTKITPGEARQLYNLAHEKLGVSVVTFDAAKFTNQVQHTEADLKDYYEKHKTAFEIPERRKLKYVRFDPQAYTNEIRVADFDVKDEYEKNSNLFRNDAGKQLPFEKVADDIRKDLLEARLRRHAQELATQLMLDISSQREEEKKKPAEIDLAALTQKFKATVQETDYVEPSNTIPGIDPGFNFFRAAYALTVEEPFGEPVVCADGVYVLQFLGSKEPEQPPLEQVKDKVVLRLVRDQALEMARVKGRDAARQVRNAVLAATTDKPDAMDVAAKKFTEETQKLGLEVVSPPPFSQQDLRTAATEQNDRFALLNAAFAMRPGEVSEFVETARGGLFLLMKERVLPSNAEFEKDRPQFLAQLTDRRKDIVLNDWFNREFQRANPPPWQRAQQQQQQRQQQQQQQQQPGQPGGGLELESTPAAGS